MHTLAMDAAWLVGALLCFQCCVVSARKASEQKPGSSGTTGTTAGRGRGTNGTNGTNGAIGTSGTRIDGAYMGSRAGA
jgi:hypothetical protein